MLTKKQKILKARMLKRCDRMIRECEQGIRDTLYWNSINPNETPLDVEPERVTIALLRKFQARLRANNGEHLESPETGRILATLRS